MLRWLAASLLLVWLAAPHWPEQIDDVFITGRFASEWATTGVLAWSGGERIEGYSNLLWLLVMRGLWATPFDPGFMAKCLSMLLAVCLLGLCAARLPRGRGGNLVLLGIAGSGALGYWATTGMETLLFAALTSSGYALSLSRTRPRLVALGAWLCGLAALTRPEGLGWLALALIAILQPPRRQDAKDRWLDRWRAAAFGAVLLPAGYALFRVSYFGDLLPAAAYVKARFGVEGVRQCALELATFAPVLVAALAVLHVERSRRAWVFAPLLLSTAVLLGIDGDWMGHGRLLLPGLGGALGALLALGEPRELPRARVWVLGAATLGVSLLETPFMEPPRLRTPTLTPWRSYTSGLDTPLAEVVRYLVQRAPADATVQSADVGMLAHIPRLTLLDSRGLCTRSFLDAKRTQRWEPLQALYSSSNRPRLVVIAQFAPPGSPAPAPLLGLDPWLAPLDETFTAHYPLRETFHVREGRWTGTVRVHRFEPERASLTLQAERWRALARRFPRQPLFAAELARLSHAESR